MNIARSRAASVILAKRLYVIGGEGDRFRYLNQIEYFDPNKNRWISQTPMIERRAAPQAGVVNGYLFVLGGYTRDMVHSSIEMFDSVKNNWSMVSEIDQDQDQVPVVR